MRRQIDADNYVYRWQFSGTLAGLENEGYMVVLLVLHRYP
jgi:hypothetical protein